MKVIQAILLVLVSAFPALAQQTQVGENVAGNMDAVSMLLSLFMVLGLIIVCALILKKFQTNQQQLAGMKVISTLHLSTKERLVVVEVGEKQVLLGVTAHQITKLETLDTPLEVPQQAVPSWTQLKKNVLKQ